jgi:hypothetical protein
VENTGDAGGGRTPFRIVREWTSDMFLWNVLLVWGLRDFNLNGPQRVFWFCATGFAMTSVWYIVLQRLARPPPVRLLKKYPLILLALLGFAALAAWVAVLYFSLSSQLIND